jgi:hypothetical protein
MLNVFNDNPSGFIFGTLAFEQANNRKKESASFSPKSSLSAGEGNVLVIPNSG